MDHRRFTELKEKRFKIGLSDEEADELGRMMAEERREAYANARDREPDTEALDRAEDFPREEEPGGEGEVYDDLTEPHRELRGDEVRQAQGADPSTTGESRDVRAS